MDRPGTQRSLFPAVQIEYADGTRVVGVVRVLDIPDQLQWDAIDGPDAELDGAFVGLGEQLVVEVGDELWFGGGEHLFGDLPAGPEGVAGQRGLPGPAPERELQCAGRVDEHDEAAFGPAQGDRVVDHHDQHLLEHLGGAQSAEPFEQGGGLAQVTDGRGRDACGGLGGVLEQEPEVRVSADPDPVVVTERVFDYGLVVDERAGARAEVAQDVAVLLLDDLGVEP